MKAANPMQLKMIFLSIVAVLSLIALIAYFTTDKKNVEENKDNLSQSSVVEEGDMVDKDKIKEIEENYTDEKEEGSQDEEEHLHEETIDYEAKYKEELGKSYPTVTDTVEELARLYVTDESDLGKWSAFLSEELLEEKKESLTDGFVKRVIDTQAFPIQSADDKTFRFEVRVVWTVPSEENDSGKETWVTISYDPSQKLATELMIN